MTKTVIRKNFGEKIRRLRKQQGSSQEKLAQEAGIERSYMGAIERGERNPSLEKIASLAKALKTSVSKLFEN